MRLNKIVRSLAFSILLVVAVFLTSLFGTSQRIGEINLDGLFAMNESYAEDGITPKNTYQVVGCYYVETPDDEGNMITVHVIDCAGDGPEECKCDCS